MKLSKRLLGKSSLIILYIILNNYLFLKILTIAHRLLSIADYDKVVVMNEG